ncbi:hypothetical protein EJ05DRAFT_478235 [Pseudovirgaria hyperparasitica]|uniref:NADH-ubiquinone oxidoreductase B12 subunit n=1 Tax=Pseudovirgaria hyperparasitica TaxID=470096 RepID=A0A6A6W2I2_9PEZI|nr:uncharacterized protein EJ05DRAFT_478235 [Pseudovirgaria hyperparasitica]KAF2756224.1 hypothetical protein EJ05DRAFT_478235 [Pseudovirgaria hyperparasitica]
MAPKPNLTGFDPQKLAASSGMPANDPWKRYEAWRYTGPFSTRNRFRRAFPGLGIATVAFAGYLVFEAVFLKEEHHGHDKKDDHH